MRIGHTSSSGSWGMKKASRMRHFYQYLNVRIYSSKFAKPNVNFVPPFDDCYRSNASADLDYTDVIPLRTTTATQTSATRLHDVWLSFTGTIEQKRRTTKIVGWIGFIRTSIVTPLTLRTVN